MRKYAAELLGTFVLVFAGTGAIVVNDETGALGHAGVAITFGLVVLAMIHTFGSTSGAHLNPAVTLALATAKELPRTHTIPYIAAQTTGAITGVWLAHLMFDLTILQTSTHIRTGIGQFHNLLGATLSICRV